MRIRNIFIRRAASRAGFGMMLLGLAVTSHAPKAPATLSPPPPQARERDSFDKWNLQRQEEGDSWDSCYILSVAWVNDSLSSFPQPGSTAVEPSRCGNTAGFDILSLRFHLS